MQGIYNDRPQWRYQCAGVDMNHHLPYNRAVLLTPPAHVVSFIVRLQVMTFNSY